jgi:hypothetical protein
MTIDYARAYGNERRTRAEMRRRQRAAASAAKAQGSTGLTAIRRAIGRLLTSLEEPLCTDPSAQPEGIHPLVGARL